MNVDEEFSEGHLSSRGTKTNDGCLEWGWLCVVRVCRPVTVLIDRYSKSQ